MSIFPFFKLIYSGGGAVGESLRLASERLGVRIPAVDIPSHSRCGTLKGPHCSMAISAEHRPKSVALHRQCRRLHMSKKFLSGTKNPKQTNKLPISEVEGVIRCLFVLMYAFSYNIILQVYYKHPVCIHVL